MSTLSLFLLPGHSNERSLDVVVHHCMSSVSMCACVYSIPTPSSEHTLLQLIPTQSVSQQLREKSDISQMIRHLTNCAVLNHPAGMASKLAALENAGTVKKRLVRSGNLLNLVLWS